MGHEEEGAAVYDSSAFGHNSAVVAMKQFILAACYLAAEKREAKNSYEDKTWRKLQQKAIKGGIPSRWRRTVRTNDEATKRRSDG